MHHAGQAQVLHVGDAAGHLGRDVDARQRLADHAVGRRVLELGLRLRLDVQQLGGGELADSWRGGRRLRDDGVLRRQLLGRNAEARGRGADQEFARLRRGVADGGAAVLHRLAAGGVAFVRRLGRVGRDESICPGSTPSSSAATCSSAVLMPWPSSALPVKTVMPSASMRIQASSMGVVRRLPGRRGGCWCRRGGSCANGAAGKREADDQRAAAGQQLRRDSETGVRALIAAPPGPSAIGRCDRIARAARRTAARMRIWVPQRHRLGLMCARISSSEGGGLRRSSACARMIMPGMQ